MRGGAKPALNQRGGRRKEQERQTDACGEGAENLEGGRALALPAPLHGIVKRNGQKISRPEQQDDVGHRARPERNAPETTVSVKIPAQQSGLEKIRQTFQIAGAPPKTGSSCLPSSGSIQNSRKALMKSVRP